MNDHEDNTSTYLFNLALNLKSVLLSHGQDHDIWVLSVFHPDNCNVYPYGTGTGTGTGTRTAASARPFNVEVLCGKCSQIIRAELILLGKVIFSVSISLMP